MSIREHIKTTFTLPTSVVHGYLADLTDDDLMIRPHQKSNHIAWQLGHLITAEHNLQNMISPGSMPDLPDGFAEQHGKEKASSDTTTVAVIAGQNAHWMMHTGQWAVIRRQLGKAPLF